jgi:hypothetical protein
MTAIRTFEDEWPGRTRYTTRLSLKRLPGFCEVAFRLEVV